MAARATPGARSAVEGAAGAPDAVLFATYGTTREGELARAIDPVADALACAFPGSRVARAYTSAKVLKAISARGGGTARVPSVAQALDGLASAGARTVLVQPGHVVDGIAFGAVRGAVAAARRDGRFDRIALGAPLLSSTGDIVAIADALSSHYPHGEGRAVVLMGHGADMTAGMPYAALGYRLHELGRDDIVVGAMHGYPGFEAASNLLARHALSDAPFSRERRVTIAPLMVTAGAHARRDMASPDPSSWSSKLERAGWTVAPVFEGLGALPQVRRLYADHARAAWAGRDR